jgi:large subunit ribosomal protein L9
MYAVLIQDQKNLGRKGDIVNVKRGYFVNYLYPRGVASFATTGIVAKTADERKQRVLRMEELKKQAVEISEKLAELTLEVAAKASAKGKLYGSVDEQAIINALKEQAKIELDSNMVIMPEHFKMVGEYSVRLRLTDEIIVPVSVNVTPVSE